MKKSLEKQIWKTRISRIKAEQRLLGKDSFIQGINIYYSCASIIMSFFAYIKSSAELSFLTICMTVVLFSTILYLNGQKLGEEAKDYKENYTELQKLELKLEMIEAGDSTIKDICDEYVSLLKSSNNHIPYDYYCAIRDCKEEYKKDDWSNIKFKYWFNRAWRVLLKLIVILAPAILFIIVFVLKWI